MEIDYVSIGKRIKAARKRKQLTQEKLAELADISIPYLSNIENANTSVGLNVLMSLANVLDVSLDELCCDNLVSTGRIYSNAIAEITNDCSMYELRVAENMLRELIRSLRECSDTADIYK